MNQVEKLIYSLSRERYVRFLNLLAQRHSILSASKEAGVSYRKAWEIVETLREIFGSEIFDTRIGGIHGGGTYITSQGEEVLEYLEKFRTLFVNELGVMEKKGLSELIALIKRRRVRTSARNQLEGVVNSISRKGIIVDVEIDVKGFFFLTRITEKSLKDLDLQKGKDVFLLIKAPHVRIVKNCKGYNCFEGVVESISGEKGGDSPYFEAEISLSPDLTLVSVVTDKTILQRKGKVKIFIPPEEIIVGV